MNRHTLCSPRRIASPCAINCTCSCMPTA
jgi:hypothetical protein